MKCTPIWIGLALALGSCGGVEEFGAREESNLGAAPAIDVRGPMTTRSDPIGAVYTWIDRTEAMIGRVGAGVVDQPARRRVLLYGGWQENGVRFDTWEWDGAGWLRRSPVHDPGVRIGSTLVYDEVRKRVLMTGGASEFLPRFDFVGFNSTWEWDGEDWSELHTEHAPSAVTLSGGTWDPVRQQMLVFGGFTAPTPREDGGGESTAVDAFWAFDGVDWREIPKTSPWPPAAGLNSMVWDRERNVAVLLLGHPLMVFENGTLNFGKNADGSARLLPIGETWEWDGSSWRKTGDLPGLLTLGGKLIWNPLEKRVQMVFDELVDGVLVQALHDYGGDGWPRMSTSSPMPPYRVLTDAVWSSANARLLSTGGVELGAGLRFTTKTGLTDALGGAQWETFPMPVQMPALSHAASAQLADGRVVVVGGALNGALSDTLYVWTGGRWFEGSSAAAPSARESAVMAAFGEGALLYGGAREAGFPAGDSATTTWLLDKQLQWQPLQTTPNPGVRIGATMFTLGGDVYLFGGEDGAGISNATWRFREGAWQEISVPELPAARAYACSAVQGEGAALVIGGGIGQQWFDGSRWRAEPDPGTGERVGCNLLRMDRPDRVVFVGGKGAVNTLDLWTLQPTADAVRNVASRGARGERPPRRYAAVMQNSPLGGAIMFGGQRTDSEYLLSDTWQLRLYGQACTDAAQCEQGAFCTEGNCCEVESCGPCATCAGGGGQCVPRGAGQVPGCDDAFACNAQGRCRLAIGQACTHDDTCASGQCSGLTDGGTGVCCGFEGCAVACANDHTLRDGEGRLTECAPYRCEGSRCRDSCASVNDCIGDTVCSEGRCVVAGVNSNQEEGSCGCETVGVVRSAPAWTLAAALALLVRRRRARK